MNRLTYWLIQVPAILIVVYGAQEVAVYRKGAEELNSLKALKIEELEKIERDDTKMNDLSRRIAYLERPGYFDRSIYKGLALIGLGFVLSGLAMTISKRRKGEPTASHNSGDCAPSA